MDTQKAEPPECEKEKSLIIQLLEQENSPCVCCRLWSNSGVQGWQPKEEHKTSKKQSSRGNYGSLRRERTILTTPRVDFLFRHYECLDRYIQQYRENHSTSCMEQDGGEVNAVLGVNVPDPYLPKISTPSVLIERLQIIEALSDYYNTKSDANKICLTGQKARFLEITSLPTTPRKSISAEALPHINNNTGLLPTVNENEECTPKEKKTRAREASAVCQTLAGRLKRREELRTIGRITNSSGGRENTNSIDNLAKSKKETLILPAAKLVCNEKTSVLPQIHLWATCRESCRNEKDKSDGSVLETLRIGKKVKNTKDSSSGEELSEVALNLRSLETRESVSPGGGILRLGTTVRAISKEQRRKIKANSKQQIQFSSENSKCLTKNTNGRETTFIRILGHQKVPPPPTVKDSNIVVKKNERYEATNSARKSSTIAKDSGIPLSYLRRFGRNRFYHVLEARSYKPETRKLGTTIIPN